MPNPELMFTSLVEEFARQGFDADHIMQLFDTPFFQATWGLRLLYGEQGVRARVEATIARCGVMRFRTQHAMPGDATCSEGEIPDILNCAPPPSAVDNSSEHGSGGNDA